MAYATVQQHLDIRGASNVLNALKGSPVLKQQLILEANEAGAQDIDGAAEEGGFVVPLVPADLSEDPERRIRLENWLRMKNVIIASYFYLQVLDTTEQVKRAQEWCMDVLERLRQGKGLVPPATTTANTLTLFSMPGASRRLTQLTLQESRRVLL